MVGFPDTLPKEENIIVDEQPHRKVVVSLHDEGASVDMYLRPHNEYGDIVPDDAADCELYDEPTEGTPTTELPDMDRKPFVETVDVLLGEYELDLKFDDNSERYGVCTSCLGEQAEELLFTVHLER